MFMAYWPVREKQVPVAIVELLEGARRRRVRREIRQAHWIEQAAPCLAVEKRQAPATLRRALSALPACPP